VNLHSYPNRYNGRATDPPDKFPPELEEACRFAERIVNQEMKKRSRSKLEWGGGTNGDPMWRANVAASNCYRGGQESVGFHSDQLTYLGPYPTIASLSLGKLTAYYHQLHGFNDNFTGTRRNFSLREVIPNDQVGIRKAQTFNVPLPHNSVSFSLRICPIG
jgi:alkylated DNA repair dioxygenase AlkB